jgi:hypothetical protein
METASGRLVIDLSLLCLDVRWNASASDVLP